MLAVLLPRGQQRHPARLGWHRHPHHLHHRLHLPGCHRHLGKDGRRVALRQLKWLCLSRTTHLVKVNTTRVGLCNRYLLPFDCLS